MPLKRSALNFIFRPRVSGPVAAGLALLVTAAALGIKLWSDQFLRINSPFGFFFTAIFVSGCFGGLTGGLTATFLSIGLIRFYFLGPVGSASPLEIDNARRLILFSVNSVLVSSLFGIIHRALYRLSVVQAVIQNREQELLTANREAQLARRQAEASDQAKSLLIANVSHEIRSSLGAVLGFADLMRDPSQNFHDRLECVDTIKRSGAQLSRVINDLLDLSKIESGKLEIEKTIFAPQTLLIEIVDFLRRAASDKGLRLESHLQGPISPAVQSDPLRLRQILVNLIGNAIKFTQQGCIKITMSETDSHLRLEVEDTGCGLSDEQASRLFQPFSQAAASTTRVYGGTGLGLSLSKQLARCLGGDLTLISSSVDVGSQFLIEIDIGSRNERAALQIPLSQTAEQASPEASISGRRILVVDDSREHQALLQRVLRGTGALIESAFNGRDGAQMARKSAYDLVLMDLQMPEVDGFESFTQLRRSGFAAPIVALTAHAMKGDREACLDFGFDGYLQKPIEKDILIATVSRLLAEPRIAVSPASI